MQAHDWWVYFGWWVINILFPIALPLVILRAWGKFSIPPSSNHAIKSIGKGELFWAAMAMAASAGSELYALRQTLTDPHAQGVTTASIFLMGGVIIYSVVLVAIGSGGAASAGASSHIPNPAIFRASIRTLIFTIVAYSASHLVVVAHEVQSKAQELQTAKDEKDAIIKGIKDCLTNSKSAASLKRCAEDKP